MDLPDQTFLELTAFKVRQSTFANYTKVLNRFCVHLQAHTVRIFSFYFLQHRVFVPFTIELLHIQTSSKKRKEEKRTETLIHRILSHASSLFPCFRVNVAAKKSMTHPLFPGIRARQKRKRKQFSPVLPSKRAGRIDSQLACRADTAQFLNCKIRRSPFLRCIKLVDRRILLREIVGQVASVLPRHDSHQSIVGTHTYMHSTLQSILNLRAIVYLLLDARTHVTVEFAVIAKSSEISIV